ncbi:MAG: thioredoxin family protein [Adhaeribacter sp.]
MNLTAPVYKFLLAACFLLLPGLLLPAQAQKKQKKAAVNWVSFEQAEALQKKEPRKILVDVYTDWCGWCHQMDKRTYTDPAVVHLINTKYYAVKLDAEGGDPITVKGRTYKFNQAKRTHEAALALLNGRTSYPTTVFLDETMSIITPVPGYLDPGKMMPLLGYFGDNHYKKKSFAEYTAAAKLK